MLPKGCALQAAFDNLYTATLSLNAKAYNLKLPPSDEAISLPPEVVDSPIAGGSESGNFT